MIIHSPIISGSLTFAEGATVTYPDGGEYSGSFSGSAQFSTIGSDLIPDTSGAYDLGSEAYPFQDLWLVGNTLNIGGIGISKGIGGINIKNKSDGSSAKVGVAGITIGGALGDGSGKNFDLNDDGDLEITDDSTGDGINLVVGGLLLSSSNGAVTMSVDENGNLGTTNSTGQASSNLSGSFTGSVQDLVSNGDATFNDAVTVSGLSSLDGGINVADNLTVDASGNTVVGGTLDTTGLASLDGGIDVDGAFTVADSSGNVVTTGTITVPEGNLTIGSTAVTSTAAELNILDGVTSDATELNLLDGSTAGTVTNSKAVVYGASGEVNATTLQIGGTSITSTAAELNLLDGSTAGTVANSKAVVYGAAGEVNATKLQVGGVDITSTPAELNILDGVTATTAELNILDGVTVDATKINYLSDVTGNLKNYIDTEVAGIVDSAPAALDTLNELAAALGDDANFSTTISAQIGGKVSQSLALTAGNGLTGGGDLTTDRTFNVAGTLNRISVSADAVDIASTYVGQTSITTLGTIGTGTWQGDAIAHDYIGLDAIDGTNIADNAIDSEHYTDGSIDRVHLAADIVDGTKIADDAINSEHIADGAVDNVHLAGSIAASKITEISNLTAAEGAQLENIGTTTISATQWGYLGSMNQGVATGDSVTFSTVSATGDIVAYASSDERLKDNIEVISNPIEKVQQLKGVTWDWNDNADELQKSLPNVGVIAQDVEKVLPQLVKDRDNGFKGVDYDKIVGLLIEAIKDQQTQIDELKSKLS